MTIAERRRGSKLRHTLWCATLVCAMTQSALATETAPPAGDEALQHYERAIALHADEAYDAALVELRRAYELRPSYKIIFNMAQVQVAMKDYASALVSYRRYLDEGGAEVPEKRRSEIEAQVATLEQRVATLTITTDVPNVEVFIDDTLLGKTPNLSPVLVNAGVRKFTLRHPDYDVQAERVSVLGGTQRQLAFSLSQRKVTESATPVQAPPPPGGGESASNAAPTTTEQQGSATDATPFRVEPWMPWALTGVLGAAALTTGAFTLSANSELSDMRGQADLSRAALQDQSGHVGNLALATDILLGATVIAAGVSAWLTWGGSSTSETANPTHTLRFAITPRAAVLSGSF